MKKKYLIILDPSQKDEILIDRVRTLGPSYVFWDNHWMVETTLNPKEIYEKIVGEEFKTSSLLIIEAPQNYYGRMNTTLWDWMASK